MVRLRFVSSRKTRLKPRALSLSEAFFALLRGQRTVIKEGSGLHSAFAVGTHDNPVRVIQSKTIPYFLNWGQNFRCSNKPRYPCPCHISTNLAGFYSSLKLWSNIYYWLCFSLAFVFDYLQVIDNFTVEMLILIIYWRTIQQVLITSVSSSIHSYLHFTFDFMSLSFNSLFWWVVVMGRVETNF